MIRSLSLARPMIPAGMLRQYQLEAVEYLVLV